MWHVTAIQRLTCDGCGHPITEGQVCVSDLPEQLPKKITRRNYRHFHLDCPECNPASAEISPSCYQVVAAQLVSEKAKEETVCLDCGHLILEGEDFIQDFFYVRDTGDGIDDFDIEQGPASILATFLKGNHGKPTSFAHFSHPTIRKFMQGGLGKGRGSRSFQGARRFYQDSVPGPVRNLGEGAVNQFTKGKQASHIESVAKAPGKAGNSKNIIWESGKANLKRGPRNMTRMERIGARSVNAADTIGIIGKAATRNAGRGAAWAVVFELPVSVAENGISYFKGKKTRQEAAKDTGKNMAAAGATGGVIAAGTTVAVALGAGSALTAATPILVPVGVGMFALSAGSRIWRAWKDNLARVEFNFHADCPDCETDSDCYTSFADWVSSYPGEETLAGEMDAS